MCIRNNENNGSSERTSCWLSVLLFRVDLQFHLRQRLADATADGSAKRSFFSDLILAGVGLQEATVSTNRIASAFRVGGAGDNAVRGAGQLNVVQVAALTKIAPQQATSAAETAIIAGTRAVGAQLQTSRRYGRQVSQQQQ